MKQTLNVKVSQQLTLSPQLQQAIKLLQLSTLELNEEIDRMVEENPLLEKEDGDEENAGEFERDRPEIKSDTTSDSSSEPAETAEAGADNDEEPFSDIQSAFDDPGSVDQDDFVITSDEGGMSAEDDDLSPQYATSESLREHLLNQLAMTPADAEIRIIVQALIDELSDDGYLTTSREAFCKQYHDDFGVTPKLFDKALALLQSFDPTGIAGRDLSECLILQLSALPASEARDTAMEIARAHLPDLAKHAFPVIKKALKVPIETVQEAYHLIRTLNPRPGSAYSNERINHIVPDTIVHRENGRWVANLNEAAIPKVRINALYARALSARKSEFSSSNPAYLQEAQWLLRNIQQRFETILRVSRAIVDRQQRFFDHGAIAMQPMVLKDVAELLGLHESTISRVTTKKYMLTPQGVFELKYFFGSYVSTSAGGVASSTAIRSLIKQMVSEEAPEAPLSDQRISELLDKEGIMVARRTVAKYRESLLIPPAHQRRARF